MKSTIAKSIPWFMLLLLSFGTGCSSYKSRLLDQELLTKNVTADLARVNLAYQVHYPDVLELRIAGHPLWTGRFPIQDDGRLHFSNGDVLLVEGMSTPQIAQAIAENVGAKLEKVHVHVAEHQSQQLFVYGKVRGQSRVVDYQGPETVLSLLQRLGGLSRGAAPSEVQIVRAHVAEGKQPEIFNVDLEACLLEKNPAPMVRLQPFDQIYVGQSHKSSIERLLPRWLRPLYAKIVGLPRMRLRDLTVPLFPRLLRWSEHRSANVHSDLVQ